MGLLPEVATQPLVGTLQPFFHFISPWPFQDSSLGASPHLNALGCRPGCMCRPLSLQLKMPKYITDLCHSLPLFPGSSAPPLGPCIGPSDHSPIGTFFNSTLPRAPSHGFLLSLKPLQTSQLNRLKQKKRPYFSTCILLNATFFCCRDLVHTVPLAQYLHKKNICIIIHTV